MHLGLGAVLSSLYSVSWRSINDKVTSQSERRPIRSTEYRKVTVRNNKNTRTIKVIESDYIIFTPTQFKGPFIAIQLNSTRHRVELSCVAINGPLYWSDAQCFIPVRPSVTKLVNTIFLETNEPILMHEEVVHRARA